jgi:hypothetical protein
VIERIRLYGVDPGQPVAPEDAHREERRVLLIQRAARLGLRACLPS